MLYGMLDINIIYLLCIWNYCCWYYIINLIDVSEVCGLWYILRWKENRELRLCDL